MSDYIDKVFDEAVPTGFSDVSKEEQYRQLGLNTPPQRPEQKQQQQAPQNKTNTGRIAGANNAVTRDPLQQLAQGASKWITENVGIPAVDFIDNTFQGNKYTPDQIAKEAAKLQAKDKETFKSSFTNNKPQAKTPEQKLANEAGGVLAGGTLGAVESVLNTAEIAGDAVKTFASLGRVKEDQNPFSNKYQWASWDLGKNEAGAQSGVGKVAQGFLEFGLLAAGTGGFANLPGAATKFAQAGTALGKAGVVAKAAGYAGLHGLSADLMSATRGEGNLSNLIKENAPEWYPTWLTALAVDEDDSPFEAMLKTGLEGFGIGGAADAVGAYLGGTREIRRALKAGAASEEAAQAGVRAAQERLSQATPNQPTYLNRAEGILTAQSQTLGEVNVARKASLDSVINQSRHGIPVAWDDAAEVVPEMFSPGARAVDQIDPNLGRLIPDLAPGQSYILDPVSGVTPPGFAVDIDFKQLDDLSPEGIAEFIGRNEDLLSREDVAVRIFVDDEGVKVAELVRIVPDEAEAQFLGNLFDKPSIQDAALGTEIPLFGKDSLRGTDGQHIASHFGTPMESRIVDSTTAVRQQMQARSDLSGARGGAQRTVTDAQLRQMARAVGDGPGDLLRRMTRENPVDLNALSSISRKSVDEITQEAAVGIKEALGIAGDVDFSKILKQAVGEDELLTQAGIVQVRGLMQELGNRLYESSYATMKLGEANMDNFQQVQRMADDLKALMRIHKESANAYSRYLHTYKVKVPFLGIEIDNPIKAPSVEELAQEIKNADKVLDDLVSKMASADPTARAESFRLANAILMAEGDPSKLPTVWKWMGEIATGKALNIMYNSMLSGPKTHEINILSNAINTIYRPIAAATGGDARIKKAAIASMYGLGKNIQDAFAMAGKAMKDGPISEGSKTLVANAELDQRFAILQRSAEVSNDQGFKAGVGFLSMMKAVSDNPWFNWPSKLLTGSDEFFKVMVSRMEFNSQTMLKAIDESAGTSQPLKEVFERLSKEGWEKSFGPDGKILDSGLLQAAKDTTFQTDLEGWAKSFGQVVNEVPPLRVFFPFVKTGHNIMVYAGTHVPVLNRFLSEYKAVMAGNDEYAKAVFRGREAYGQLLVLGGGIAAYNGIITGNGPPDPQERKLWLLSNQPRSINLTRLSGGSIKGPKGQDKFLDYSRIEPFGQILSGVADIAAMVNAGQLSEDRAQYLAGYLTYAIAANFTQKSYLQGVVPLGQVLTPGWQGLNTLTALPPTLINNFLPLSGLRRTIANAMTPYQLEFNGQFEQLQRLAYQASGGLIKGGASTQYDFLTGEPVPSQSGGLNALMPLAVTDRGGNKLKDALEDIEFDSSFIVKSIAGNKLTGEQKSQLQLLMGKSGLDKELLKIVTHPDFNRQKEEFISAIRGGERIRKEDARFYSIIVDTVEQYRDNAMSVLRERYPELQGRGSRTVWTAPEKPKSQEEQYPSQDYLHQGLINMPN